jgi:hypothetical protein
MSYEGRAEYLCKNGHRFILDCNDYEPYCKHCKDVPVWGNSIDDTNYDSYGHIPEKIWKSWIVTPARFEVCNLGHNHMVAPEQYRIPTDEETRKARHYYNAITHKVEPID